MPACVLPVQTSIYPTGGYGEPDHQQGVVDTEGREQTAPQPSWAHILPYTQNNR